MHDEKLERTRELTPLRVKNDDAKKISVTYGGNDNPDENENIQGQVPI